MAGFEDDKHPRDDKGRFTASGELGPSAALSAYAAQRGSMKHGAAWGESDKTKSFKSGRRVDTHVAVKKLEGYSKADGPAKGKVEGRARDIEVPLLGKNQERVFGTGEIPLEAGSISQIAGGARLAEGMWKIQEHLGRLVGNASDEKRRIQTQVLKDQQAFKKLNINGLQGSGALRDVLDTEHGEKNGPGNISQWQEKWKNAPEKDKEKARRYYDRWRKSADAYVKAEEQESARESAFAIFNTLNKKNDLLFKHSDLKFSINHTPNGEVQLHFFGESKDSEYPGEKELSITVSKPNESRELYEMAPWGANYKAGKSPLARDRMAKVTVEAQFPQNKRGKDHPFHAIVEGFGLGRGENGWAGGEESEKAQEVVNNFFKDHPERDTESDRFAAAHPDGTGIEKMGGGKPGVLWKPTGKTLADYER